MITYEIAKGGIKVKLGGRYVGDIISVKDGYCYKPKGKPAGEVFDTVAGVKRSIEGE